MHWGQIPQVYTVDLSQLSFYYLCVSVCDRCVCWGAGAEVNIRRLHCSLPHLFETGSLAEPGAHLFKWCWLARGIHLSPHPQHWDCRQLTLSILSFFAEVLEIWTQVLLPVSRALYLLRQRPCLKVNSTNVSESVDFGSHPDDPVSEYFNYVLTLLCVSAQPLPPPPSLSPGKRLWLFLLEFQYAMRQCLYPACLLLT